LKRSFTVHPYKRTTIGRIPDLNAATLGDVRHFFQSYYRPDNATLVVVGDFDPLQLDAWIDKYFGPLPKSSEPIARVSVQEPPRRKPQRMTMRDAAVPLPAFAATFLAPDLRNDDALPLELAVEMLAGGESSRLHRVLVYEKQLAQSVEGSADLREDPGLLVFKVVLANGRVPEEVEAVCFAEFDRLCSAPPSEAELAKAKNRLLISRLRQRETNLGKGLALGQAAVLLRDDARVNADLGRLQAVSAEQVHAAARKVLAENNRLVLEVVPDKARGGKTKKRP
jgi:zinc protease